MKPRHIYLLRHAQSQGNVDRRIHATVPDWKLELTDKGREQAARAGLDLSAALAGAPLGVYVSPFRRTMDTWGGMGIPHEQAAFVKQDPRLREQEWGGLRSYEDRTWEDIEGERDAYGPFFFRFLAGESGADVYDRMTGFLDTLYRDFEKSTFPDNVLIVTHGFAMRVLLMRWLHWTVDQFHALGNPPNCFRAELRLNGDDYYELMTPLPPPWKARQSVAI